MDYDRAVRLRELWNGSFRLNLQIKTDFDSDFNLSASRSEISEESLTILKHLADRLNLKLKTTYAYHTVS